MRARPWTTDGSCGSACMHHRPEPYTNRLEVQAWVVAPLFAPHPTPTDGRVGARVAPVLVPTRVRLRITCRRAGAGCLLFTLRALLLLRTALHYTLITCHAMSHIVCTGGVCWP
jgi:hypothetical protein